MKNVYPLAIIRTFTLSVGVLTLTLAKLVPVSNVKQIEVQ